VMGSKNSEGLLIKNHDPDRELFKNSMSEGKALIEAKKLAETKKHPKVLFSIHTTNVFPHL
jgi:hypothetical protein